MKNVLLAALIFLLPPTVKAAEDFSYVYIQGDKQTPFYVKLEEGMQPRYGKNYCILSRLAPGPAKIEILFQQNAFPPQLFHIQVPENGTREFLLVRQGEGFNLYDLQQGFYLPAGNKITEDRLPDAASAAAQPVAQVPRKVPERNIYEPRPKPRTDPAPAEPGVIGSSVKKAGEVIAKGRDKSAEFARKAVEPLRPATQAPAEAQRSATDGKPGFIKDLELSTPNSAPGATNTTKTGVGGSTTTIPPPIVNSDCPNGLNAADFGKVFNGMASNNTDEARVEYFGRHLDKCYESWQARTLAGRLESDAARYELLRKIYPRITDQGAFLLLDDLLTAPVWKEAFNRLVHR